jgi:hypothetical protein
MLPTRSQLSHLTFQIRPSADSFAWLAALLAAATSVGGAFHVTMRGSVSMDTIDTESVCAAAGASAGACDDSAGGGFDLLSPSACAASEVASGRFFGAISPHIQDDADVYRAGRSETRAKSFNLPKWCAGHAAAAGGAR